ncbi:MAG TPA: efflux RND transporter periplasmic adaptor subunit [Stellaceae bacterium]
MRRRFILLLLACCGGGAAYYGLLPSFAPGSAAQSASGGSPPPARAVPVVVAEAAAKSVPVQITTIGRAQTIASVAVKSRIDGQITGVAISDGQEVKAGDVLFKLDDRPYQAALHQAEATLARDKAQLENARREVDRLTPLSRRDFVSRQQVDQTRTTAVALEATVRADEAQVESAQVQLSYTVIRAPIDGRVGTISFKLGSAIKANDTPPLVTLNQIRPIYVAFSVPQRNFADIHKAMAKGAGGTALPVSVSIPGDRDGPLDGKVTYIENLIDPSSSTLSVKATFGNDANRLWPGQFVNVTVTLAVEPNAITIPSEAVQAGQKGPFVFVLKPDSTVEARTVTLDRTIGTEAVIATGLAAGEKVVVNGQLRLDNGTKVEVRPTGAPTAQES